MDEYVSHSNFEYALAYAFFSKHYERQANGNHNTGL